MSEYNATEFSTGEVRFKSQLGHRIYSLSFIGFPTFLRGNSRILSRLGHVRFRSNSFAINSTPRSPDIEH
jgi:hypothetical protein